MAKQRQSEKGQIALARSLALLACGNKLVDTYDGYLAIQSEDGTLYWSGPEQSFREIMASVQKERATVQGFSCEVVYGISEQGHAVLSGLPVVDWQQVLQRPVVLRPYPGSSKSFEATLGEIGLWWMASPQGDSNIYLYVETGGRRGIAFKKDNAALYRSGLLPEYLDRRKFHNPYAFLARQSIAV